MFTIGNAVRGSALRYSFLYSCHLLLITITLCSGTAVAQDNDSGELEEVIVTGSRIGRTGFDSPNPVTVIDSSTIEDLGLVNVGDVMRTIPQNTPFFTETNVGIGNFNVGAQLANLRGLNPFFGTRTLTLVDTKRVVPNTEGGAIDLTLIPSMLVERTEVVTGGASAAYGSDAIAGVVNVILDTDLDGAKASIDFGQTFEGDGDDLHAAFAAGTAFADGRGHVVAGAEYQKLDGVGPCSQVRDWCREAWAVGTNAGFAAGNGLPNFVVRPNAKFPTSDTGLFTPWVAPFTAGGAQQQFNTAGTALQPYDPGQFGGVFSRIGGDGSLLAYNLSNIRPDTERYSILGHVTYEMTDSLSGFAEINYARSETENFPANGGLGPLAAIIAPDNAFLSPAVQAVAPAGGLFARIFMPDVFSARNTTEAETVRFVAGLDGKLDFINLEDWSWDAYYQYGRSEYHQQLINNATGQLGFFFEPEVYNFLGWAIDAVDDGTGNIVCRATLPGPFFDPLAEGCIPLNIFGTGNADPAAIDYAYRTLKEDSTYDQHVFGANVRGMLFEGWAGPIGAAAGLEWRNDDANVTHDMANQPWYDAYFLSWAGDRGGEIDVLEGYVEVQVPIANNRPGIKSLEVDLAVRYTRNEATSNDNSVPSSSNSFASWKAAGVYDVNDWLRFRGSVSRDVRAAGFRELFLPRNEVLAVAGGFPNAINNPWNGNAVDDYLSITGGNPALTPEEADTITVGVVLQPGGILEGARFSMDWFEIDLADAITPGGLGGVSTQGIVDACFASGGTGEVCNKVTGAGTNDITAVDASSINIGNFISRGLDFEAGYSMPVSRLFDGFRGDLNMRVIATYLYDMIIDTGLGSPAVNYHGQSGPVASFGGFNTQPDWQARLWLTYSLDRFSAMLETRYIGAGSLNATWFESPAGSATNTQLNSVNINSVEDVTYVTLSGTYRLPVNLAGKDREIELFGVINNLFDRDPPVAPGGNFYPTNPVFFDTYGARFRIGMRVEF